VAHFEERNQLPMQHPLQQSCREQQCNTASDLWTLVGDVQVENQIKDLLI